eukprot:1161563-Pelagomonas_calceolata.AAC.4
MPRTVIPNGVPIQQQLFQSGVGFDALTYAQKGHQPQESKCVHTPEGSADSQEKRTPRLAFMLHLAL